MSKKKTPRTPRTPAPPREAKERRLPVRWLPPLYSLLLAALTWTFLYQRNADLLWFLQDRDAWTSTPACLHQSLQLPGGMLGWAGACLTQFFHHPWLGTLLWTLLSLLLFHLMRLQYRVRPEWSFLLCIPPLALVVSQVQLGYWVYFLKDADYTFQPLLGLLLSVALSYDFTRLLPLKEPRRPIAALALMVLLTALAYRPLGLYALLIPLLTALRILRHDRRHGLPALAAALLTILAVPLLETQGTTLMRPDQPWLQGLHRFQLSTAHDCLMELPQLAAISLTLLAPLLPSGDAQPAKPRTLWLSQLLMLLSVGSLTLWTLHSEVTDPNFHAELQMQRATEEGRWLTVLDLSRRHPGPVTRQMYLFRTIALLHQGHEGDTYCTYNNQLTDPLPIADTLYTRVSDQAADLIYYSLGETNFAIRRAIERCMHYGYGYYTLRMLTRCALVNGESDVARKYLNLLSHTTFQRQWARRMQTYVDHPDRLGRQATFRLPLQLHHALPDELGTDRALVDQCLVPKLAYTQSPQPQVQRIALFYSLLLKKPDLFFTQLLRYQQSHPRQPLPLCYQQAAWLWSTALQYPLQQNHGIRPEDLPVTDEVKQQMDAFLQQVNTYTQQGTGEEEIGIALRPRWGDTFWWDYFTLEPIVASPR